MVGTRFRPIACTVFSAVLLSTTPSVAAEEPNLEELLAKVPVLSPTNEALKSFYVRARLPLAGGRPVRFEAAWSAPDEFALSAIVGDAHPTPVLFFSEGRGLMFDSATAVVHFVDDRRPSLQVGVVEENVAMGIYITPSKKPKMIVDPPSFFRGLGDHAQWTKLTDTRFRYTNLSKSGSTRVTAEFNVSQPMPLVKLNVAQVEDSTKAIVINEIRVNEPIPQRLRTFPDRDRLPANLVAQSTKVADEQQPAGVIDEGKRLMICLLIAAVLDDEELRQGVEKLTDVDWKRAKENRDQFAAPLRELLESDEK